MLVVALRGFLGERGELGADGAQAQRLAPSPMDPEQKRFPKRIWLHFVPQQNPSHESWRTRPIGIRGES